jgi:hypothetical protein
VEGENESPEYSPKDNETPEKTPPRRATRANNRSPEPELVMPSLDADTLQASWADTTSRSARFQKAARSAEREAWRRTTRMSNGSSEKRTRTKTIDKIHSHPTSPPDSRTFQDIFLDHAGTMLSHLLDVFGGALRVLKKPISYILAIWLLFGMGLMVRNLFVTSIYASLSPICKIPGSSLLNLPFCPVHRVDTSNGPPPPVEFDQLMAVQSKFEEVLEESAGGVSLPLDMKRGEASIRDLRQLVRYSQLYSK